MLSVSDVTKTYYGPNFDCLTEEIKFRIRESGGLSICPWSSGAQLASIEGSITEDVPNLVTTFYPDDWGSVYACAEEVAIQSIIRAQRA